MTWTKGTTPSLPGAPGTASAQGVLLDVAWDANAKTFVAVGGAGNTKLQGQGDGAADISPLNALLYTSTDGVMWTAPDLVGLNGTALASITCDEHCVAVGGAGAVVTSSDARSFGVTRVYPSASSFLNMVRWGNGQFIAVGQKGVILTSPDGRAWTEQRSGTTNQLFGVTWSGTEYVAVGEMTPEDDTVVVTSSDAVTWTKHTTGGRGGLRDVAWDGSRFIGAGETVLESPDADSWTILGGDTTGTAAEGTAHVFWDGSTIRAVWNVASGVAGGIRGDSGYCGDYASEVTLQHVVTLFSKMADCAIASDGTIVGVGRTIGFSKNGGDTTQAAVLSGADVNQASFGFNAVASSGTLFVAVGSNPLGHRNDTPASLYVSPDGAVWTSHHSATAFDLRSVAWNGSVFVAVGDDGTILTSP